MSVVLVLEPDGAQAEQLLRVLRKRVRADAVLATSTAAAIEIIGNAAPDLILVSALLPPRDEDRLMSHLRSLENAGHLQTLTIPQLAFGTKAADGEKGALGRFRKKKAAAPAAAGCDPDVFANEVSSHLAHAMDLKSRPAPRRPRRVAPPEPEAAPPPPPPEEIFVPEPVPEPEPMCVEAAPEPEPEPQYEYQPEAEPIAEKA